MKKILVINPGSTSTKLAYFHDEARIYEETMDHDKQTLETFKRVADQLQYRYDNIVCWLSAKKVKVGELDAIAARGGLLHPVKSGAYKIEDKMVDELLSAKYGEHASNLGAALAQKLAAEGSGILCIIADPTCVDELCDYARLTGSPLFSHISKFHALNQKYVAGKVAAETGKKYEDCNFIVAHMGGGISIGVHRSGEIVHVNNCLDGSGPFSPERAGTIPRVQLIEMCFSGKYTEDELSRMLDNEGGLFAYLGTNNVRQIENAANDGDKKSRFYIEAMCYQIAREIAAGSAVLMGDCDAVILTGGIAFSKMVVDEITARVKHIAPVVVSPGSDENKSLAEAAMRALDDRGSVKRY